MNDLPQGWKVVSIDAVAGKPQYGWTSKAKADADGLPLLRTTDITRGPVDWPNVPRCAVNPENPGRYLLSDGDIVVSRAGSVGVSALIKDPPSAVFASYLMRIRAGEDVLPEYLRLFLQSPDYWAQISTVTNGIALPNINASKLAAIQLPLPSLEEQQHIVTVLEDHLSRLEAGEDYLRSVHRRVGLLETAWLQSSRSIGEAERVALGDLLEVPLANGRSVPTQEGGFPVLRLTALRGGRIDLSEHKEGRWTRSDAAPFLVQPGDFLVARGNGSLSLVARGGLVGVVASEVAYPDTMIRVRPHQGRLDPDYLALIWDAPSTRAQLESMARTTAGIYKVNQSHLRSVMLPLPPIDEQRRLSDSADAFRRAWSRAEVAVDLAVAESRGLRRSLLEAAFSGRLTSSAELVDQPEEVVGV